MSDLPDLSPWSWESFRNSFDQLHADLEFVHDQILGRPAGPAKEQTCDLIEKIRWHLLLIDRQLMGMPEVEIVEEAIHPGMSGYSLLTREPYPN